MEATLITRLSSGVVAYLPFPILVGSQCTVRIVSALNCARVPVITAVAIRGWVAGGEHNNSLEGSLLWIHIQRAYARRVMRERGDNLSGCEEVWVCCGRWAHDRHMSDDVYCRIWTRKVVGFSRGRPDSSALDCATLKILCALMGQWFHRPLSFFVPVFEPLAHQLFCAPRICFQASMIIFVGLLASPLHGTFFS